MKRFVLSLALLLAFLPVYASAQNVPSLFTKSPGGGGSGGGGGLSNPVGINQGGTGIDFVDPNRDQLLGWDDSEDSFAGFDLGITLITDDDTVNVTQPADRIITGTSGTLTSADCGKIVQTTNAAAVALTIDSAATAGLTQGCAFTINTVGTGTATLTPTTSTINGAASFAIPTGKGCYIRSDGTNYLVDYSACNAIPLTPRVGTTASSATPTPNADAQDVFTVTALAAGATFGAPTGTPSNGQTLIIRIKDNGTARTLAFNAIYRAIGVTLPTTTVINKTMYIAMIYNSADSKWDVIGVREEA